jgi:enoyl-CoA hydratase
MNWDHIEVAREDDGRLAILTIRREEALNALNSEVLDELINAVAELELDDTVRVVCFTGAGRAFVAGADIAQMREMTPRDAQALAQKGTNLGLAIESSPRPFIAAVNGFALGGGCELAMACDFIYASDKAKFGQPEVKLGVIPGFGGTQRLSRRVGIAKAKELVLTGATIGAEEALRIGLADAVCAPDALMDRVRATAKDIARNGPLAVGEAKRVIQDGQSMPLHQGCMVEMAAFAGLFGTADQIEGMAAFLDKRDAEFKGR